MTSAALAKEPAPKRNRPRAVRSRNCRVRNVRTSKNAAPANPILFVGSSTIRLWQTADAFPDLPIINRGFGGSTIADVNHFADRIVFKYKPRLIVFYAGDNDLAAGRTPDRVFGDFKTFVKSVRERLPGTPIIFLAIKPSPKRWSLRPLAQDVNALVEDLSKQDDNLTYIDTATPMLGPDGQPRKELFLPDDLHMNAKGYELWTKIIAPLVRNSVVRGSPDPAR